MSASNHTRVSYKASNTLLNDIHKDIGYILAKLEDIIDVVDECITILDELAREYERRGDNSGQ